MELSVPNRYEIKQQTAAFFKAVHRNKLDDVKETLAELKSSGVFPGKNIINNLIFQKTGDTAMHICATNGCLEVMRYFVEEEVATVDLINKDGKTPLHDAAQFCNLEVANYLISKGANVNAVKRADWTPLMLACTKANNFPLIQSLVRAGADVLFVNKDKWSVLHLAAREGSAEVLKFLIDSCDETERKTLIEWTTNNGRKALHTAVMHRNLDAVKFLTQDLSPSELSPEDNCKSTPLMDACRCGYLDIVEFLIDEKKLEPCEFNSDGVGLLHVTAQSNKPEMIELLIKKYELDPNVRDEPMGFTPLQWASREGSYDAVKALLELGADPDIMDDRGRTAEDIAIGCGRQDLCELYTDFMIMRLAENESESQ